MKFPSLLLVLSLLNASLVSSSSNAPGGAIKDDIRRSVIHSENNGFPNTAFGHRKSLTAEEASVRGGAAGHIFSTWSDDIDQPLRPDVTFPVNRPGDGSEEDPDGIPTRYLMAHKQNRGKALRAYHKTLEWRKEKNIDAILQDKIENFEQCNNIFPVFIPGKDPEGHLIVVQRPGMVDLEKLKQYNVTSDDVLFAYIYLVEYCWNLLDPGLLPPDGLMTVILDCQGVNFGNFKCKQFRAFGKKLVGIMSDHYPTRSCRTLIIHAPKWIKFAYNIVKPLMRESTKKKVKILKSGPEQEEILREVFGGDIPAYLESNNHGDDGPPENTDPSLMERELKLLASVGLSNAKQAKFA